MPTPQAVVDFWFLPADHPGHGRPRREWFRKDAEFDELIRREFGGAIDTTLAGGLAEWRATAVGLLAYIVVLDQFTRNIYRDTPRAFAGDALALAAAEEALAQGVDQVLPPLQRWFVYMPFEHAEDLAVQEHSVALFTALAQGAPDFDAALDYAKRHREVIARFGRFPHRNVLLERTSTAEEAEFLRQPGSSF